MTDSFVPFLHSGWARPPLPHTNSPPATHDSQVTLVIGGVVTGTGVVYGTGVNCGVPVGEGLRLTFGTAVGEELRSSVGAIVRSSCLHHRRLILVGPFTIRLVFWAQHVPFLSGVSASHLDPKAPLLRTEFIAVRRSPPDL